MPEQFQDDNKQEEAPQRAPNPLIALTIGFIIIIIFLITIFIVVSPALAP